MSDVADDKPAPGAPWLRVVRGTPNADELAALVVVAAAARSEPETRAAAPLTWSNPSRMHRRPIAEIGPGAWARSFRS